MPTSYSVPGPVATGTLTRLFIDRIDHASGRPAFQYFEREGVLADVSYAEALSTVQAVAGALRALGLERGHRAAILSENRPEWALTDYGCLCAGIEDVPVYSTLLDHQVAYLVRDSGARVLFASSAEQVAKVEAVRSELDSLVACVAFDAISDLPAGWTAWDAFLESGRADPEWTEEAFRAEALKASPEDIATLIYTSGTTGDPKGVMLSHGNLYSNVEACKDALPLADDETTLSFLPLSHVFQRMVDYLLFRGGCTIAYARSIQTVVEDIKVVRPTVVVSVPRLYEKIYSAATAASGLKGKLVAWARGVGMEAADVRLGGGEPGTWLALQYRIADRLVFSKLRAAVGGRLKYFVSGGAPLSAPINKFFYASGLTILEGYGLTETSPVTNVNTHTHFRIGTVGRPVPGTEVRIAEDGEILVRGPQVMQGYYNKPDATAAVIEAEGWFHTGDIGELDDDGYLTITDRKKDLLKTSGGKYIAPQPIENRLRTNRFVEQVVVIGDRRKFPAILIVPTFSTLESWAREQGVAFGSREELLNAAPVQALFEAECARDFADLASYERPKKIGLIAEEFSIENGILTPKQSIKRRKVEEIHADVIERFYAPENVDRTVFVSDP